MNKKTLKMMLIGLSISFSTFTNANLITNGSFETGDLSGWTTSGLGDAGTCPTNNRDWNVSSSSSTGCSNVSNPVDGSFAAYNMMDGESPLQYALSQQIFLDAGLQTANLSWMQTASWSFGGLPRVFDINLLDSSGSTQLANLYSQSYNSTGSFDWEVKDIDVLSLISGYQGQTVTIAFVTTIPQVWTGPAGFGIDAISLDITSSVPEPSTIAILTLGLFGLIPRKLKKK